MCEEITQIGDPVSTKAETVMLLTKVGKIGMSRVGERSAKVLTVATGRVGGSVICLFKVRACRRLGGGRAREEVTLAGRCDKGGG